MTQVSDNGQNEAYSEAVSTSEHSPRLSFKGLTPWSRSPQGDTLSLLGDMVKRAAAGARFTMSASDLTALEFRFGAKVAITLSGGKKLEATVSIPPGAAGRPLAEREEQVRQKLRTCFGSDGPWWRRYLSGPSVPRCHLPMYPQR